jgi:hypothetical protein
MFHHEEAMEARRRRWKEMPAGKRVLVVAGWVVLAAALLALTALVIMLLWNRIMSRVLGLPALGFWESLGLFVLAKLLFGGRGASFLGKMRMRRVMRERMMRQAADGEENLA